MPEYDVKRLRRRHFCKKKTGGAISQESLLETRNIFLTIIIYHAQDVYNFLIFSIPEPYNYVNKSHILSQILGFFYYKFLQSLLVKETHS